VGKPLPKKKPNPRSLKVKDPERYKAVVESLKNGNSLTVTSVDCGVARPTVDKIKYENKDQLTEWKWRNVNKIAGIVGKGLERLENEIDSVHINSLALQLCILIDKKAVLEDSIVGKPLEKKVILHGDFNKLLDQVRSGHLEGRLPTPPEKPMNTGVIDVGGKDKVVKSEAKGGGGGA
jgi:hypothetical protein